MIRYEYLLLTVPTITLDEATALQENYENTLKAHKALAVSFDRWGKYHLSYAVNKHEYGVYFLARFEVAQEHLGGFLEALNKLFAVRYNELVMRFVATRLDSKASLEYRRPDSLEVARDYAAGAQEEVAEVALEN